MMLEALANFFRRYRIGYHFAVSAAVSASLWAEHRGAGWICTFPLSAMHFPIAQFELGQPLDQHK
jgi:hypothetical protein